MITAQPLFILGFPPRVFVALLVSAMILAAALLLIAKFNREDRK